jgi:hypothetical protein
MDCKDSASYILAQPMCLEPFSKNAERGELRLVWDGPIEFCSGLTSRECNSYKTIHQLNLDIITNKPDYSRCNIGGRRLDGRLYVCNLIHAFSYGGDPKSRGFHGGNFTWVDATNGIVAEGKLSGITNAGTHRLPLPPPEGCEQPCQECWAPGFMDGRFCGTIRRSHADPSLLGCQIVGMYKLRFEGTLKDDRNHVTGVLEGVVIFECPPAEPQQSSSPQAELM